MYRTGWLVLIGALAGVLAAPTQAAAEAGWRVTWTDWCHMSWAREGGGFSTPPDMLGDYTHSVPVTCFSASLTGIGHELVFTALGGLLREVSFASMLFSGSVRQPLLGDGEDYQYLDHVYCSPNLECIDWSNSEFIFTSALHVGYEPPAALNVAWSGFASSFLFPVYKMSDYTPVSCSAPMHTSAGGAPIPGNDYCAPGKLKIELLHQTTPEPISMALLGTGLAGIFGVRRRRRSDQNP